MRRIESDANRLLFGELRERGNEMVASCVEVMGAHAGGGAFRHRSSEAKKAMLARASRRSSHAVGNGMGSIEFWRV